MLDLNELQIFAATAQEMSFTAAAKALGISKATASKAVVNLEARLGTRLFERTSRQITLTEAGEAYLLHLKSALSQVEEAEAAVSNLSQQPRGTLRVIMPVTLARDFVAPRLASFLKEYPDLKLEIVLRGGQLDPIAQRVDLVFQTARPEADSQTIQKRLLSLPRGLYASEKYLAEAGTPATPAELQRHSILLIGGSVNAAKWVLHKEAAAEEVRLQGRVVVGDPRVLAELCAGDLGVAMLPDWIVAGPTGMRSLQRVLPEWSPRPIELYVRYPTRLSLTPKVRVFLKFMESAGGSLENYL